MDSKAVVKPAIVLLLISAIAAGILGVVSEVTAAPIAAQNEKSLKVCRQLCPTHPPSNCWILI